MICKRPIKESRQPFVIRIAALLQTLAWAVGHFSIQIFDIERTFDGPKDLPQEPGRRRLQLT